MNRVVDDKERARPDHDFWHLRIYWKEYINSYLQGNENVSKITWRRDHCYSVFHVIFGISLKKSGSLSLDDDDDVVSCPSHRVTFTCSTILLLMWCIHLHVRIPKQVEKRLSSPALLFLFYLLLVERKADWVLPSNAGWTGRVMRVSRTNRSSANTHFALPTHFFSVPVLLDCDRAWLCGVDDWQ